MSKHRLSEDYRKGVEDFIDFAKHNSDGRSKMRCSCVNCGNLSMYREKVVREHLLCNGISLGYDEWIWHGEASTSKAKVYESSSQHQYERTVEVNEANDTIDMVEDAREHFEGNPDKFNEMLHEAENPLYPGCTKYTKLSALVKLWNLKAIGAWSDKSFSELLQLLGDMLPDNNHIPTSLHLAKSTLKSLGMEYKKIHACPNDCILYRKEYADASTCPTCKKSRWMLKKDGTVKDKVPAKVLWYFPPIPRFKRMFNSQNTARDLIWHDRQRNKDGYMRHPADSPAWKHVDTKWPEFAAEKRNLRLAISADGINPHGNPNVRYSCWPVLLVTYNLPPWLCMKRKFIMLTLLISGPKQPGNDIDVYLAPLIDDLKILWEVGVQVYDAYQKQLFNLKVVLLWTINDFPAYGCLSGCSVHGYSACPVCAEQTNSSRLEHGKKIVYTGHRRWLPINHSWRKQKNQFDGHAESRGPPESMNGNEIFNIVGRLTQKWGKKVVPPIEETTQTSRKRKKKAKTAVVERTKDDGTSSKYWKKKSIFFELEYWKFLLLRHNLDVMHIEKNVCESIIGTLLNIPGKTKDGIKSRLDLLTMGLRKELAPDIRGDKTYLPPACYTLSRNEKQVVCRTLAMIRVPDGYSSNIVNCVSMQELKLFGMKSHDCHVLMQQLLPVALRSVLPKHVRNTITRLCFFFNAICSKVVEVSRLSEIQKEIVITLCMLEKYFPPSFFDVMVHLMIHLVKEIELCGPVRFRWMYPFERYMKVLKGFVRKGNRTEGCIAEAYIAEEAIEFCTDFLSGINSVGIPVAKNTTAEDDGSIFAGKPLPGGKVEGINYESWEQAHQYVLQHITDAEPFSEKHKEEIKVRNPRLSKNTTWLDAEHKRSFVSWIKDAVRNDRSHPDTKISDHFSWIAEGPDFNVIKCQGYIINGCRFFTKNRDTSRVNQNSGVSIVASTTQISSSKDKNPVYGDLTWYGIIDEIWLLDYFDFKIPLFKCLWVNTKNGIKQDQLGFTSVELSKVSPTTEPFILASQAKQVFYVEDQVDPRWSIVLISPTRSNFEDQDDDPIDTYEIPTPLIVLPEIDEIDDSSSLLRADCVGTWVEHNTQS